MLFVSDGWNRGDCLLTNTQRLKDRGLEIRNMSVGNFPSEVDEGLLRAIASGNEVGGPFYQFIGDQDDGSSWRSMSNSSLRGSVTKFDRDNDLR